MAIRVIEEKCNGCGLCTKNCPQMAIAVDNKKAIIDLEVCNYCGACAAACRFRAITIEVDKQAQEDLSQYRGVWVFGEQFRGKVAPVVLELVGAGRKLADARNTELAVVVLGSDLSAAARELSEYPVDKVYLYEAPELAHYDGERYSRVLGDLVRALKPRSSWRGNHHWAFLHVAGGDQAYYRADGRLHRPEIGDDGLLYQTRPAFHGGNIMATILRPYTRPQMATVCAQGFPLPPKRTNGKAPEWSTST